MTSRSRVGSSAATVRAAGNVALLVCGMLLLLNMLASRRQVELISIILAVAGVGLRIEVAIRDRATCD
jgi:threonine/homoserine efflux transporter RhtA